MQQEIHTDYSEPISNDVKREQRLHRVIAATAFVFALCVLPVAQYLLVQRPTQQLASTQENGQVAGVTTTRDLGDAALATPAPPTPSPTSLAECNANKAKDTDDLQRFAEGKKKSMLSKYEVSVQPYKVALANLSGEGPDVIRERENLSQQIDQKSTAYQAELNTVEQAVASSQQAINDYVCPAN